MWRLHFHETACQTVICSLTHWPTLSLLFFCSAWCLCFYRAGYKTLVIQWAPRTLTVGQHSQQTSLGFQLVWHIFSKQVKPGHTLSENSFWDRQSSSDASWFVSYEGRSRNPLQVGLVSSTGNTMTWLQNPSPALWLPGCWSCVTQCVTNTVRFWQCATWALHKTHTHSWCCHLIIVIKTKWFTALIKVFKELCV